MGDEKENLYMVSYGFYYYRIVDHSYGTLPVINHDFYPGKSEKEVLIAFEKDKPSLEKKFNVAVLGYHIGIKDVEKVKIPGYELILKKR